MQSDHPLITAILPVPTSSGAFMSADRTGKVYIWDVKKPDPVITLIPPEDTGTVGQNERNAKVITALDTLRPNFVVSGTYGQGMNVWDLR